MTRSTKIILAIGATAMAATALAGVSLAGDRGRHHGGPHGPWGQAMHGGPHGARGQAMFENFDTNGDGKVTQAEIDQARQERLAQFDADQDGQLNLEEYQALWLDAMHEQMVDRFQALDEDGDAVVTIEEFQAPYGRVVDRLDRNDDGEVTLDELRRRHRGDGDRRDRDDDDDGDRDGDGDDDQ